MRENQISVTLVYFRANGLLPDPDTPIGAMNESSGMVSFIY